jgi:lipopolysaccharide export system protein LptA
MSELMWRRKVGGVLFGQGLALVLFWCVGVELLWAEEIPTIITSETMIARSKDRKALFKGNVVLTQGDLVVRCDGMVILFKEKASEQSRETASPSSGQKIERLVCRGHVIIKKPSGNATSEQAVYFKDQEKIVLTESPVAWQKGTRVSGLKIVMYLKEDRMEVEGESRVDFLGEGDDS